MAGIDASPEDWALLLVLTDDGPQAPSMLAEKTMRDRPTVSRLIAKLEARGLVTRSIAESDRRSQMISLSELGQAEFDRWRAVIMPIVARCRVGIAEDDMNVALGVLAKMTRNLSEGDSG